jgi:tight adherence protein B
MGGEEVIFIVMVFAAVFLLTNALFAPTFGENRKARKRLSRRIAMVGEGGESTQASISLLRDKRFEKLSPLERKLESLPGMSRLQRMLDQAGKQSPAYRVVVVSFLLGVVAFIFAASMTPQLAIAVALALFAMWLPIWKLSKDRGKRLSRFEEQLPDGLDITTRALRAGYPFSEALKVVADELEDPVAKEFGLVFHDINYGGDVRRAMLNLLERIPSITVMAFVTAVLVQREIGGNLTELLDSLATSIRGRFRFHRKVKSISAESRMSAWVITLIPFFLAGLLTLVDPEYMGELTRDPTGRQLIVLAFVMMMVGIYWIRRIIRIDV